MSAAARSTLLHPAARFAKRHNVLAVRVQMMVFRVTAANCSREMTSSPNVHLEVSRALRTCFRNKRWVLSTARALGDAFIRCWLGRVRSALQCSDLTHRLPFGCSALDEKPARTPRSSLHARWLLWSALEDNSRWWWRWWWSWRRRSSCSTWTIAVVWTSLI